ncbi:MAG: hypothetical protein V1712_01215 [Patescibacteria group bacterium]
MEEFDPKDLEDLGIEADLNDFKPDLLTRLLSRFRPAWGFKRLNKKFGVTNDVFDKAHEVFSGVQRIDIFPTASGSRGFILVLDRKTALFFYQDGDHFIYDGFEMGEYDKGDVTIFDNLK